jgi:UDP-glucose 4-epimerase
MRIVVTGASGNIGSALLRALAEEGHRVHGIARRPPAPGHAGVEWTALDLTDESDEPTLQRVVGGCDAVVNLAWAFQPMRSVDYLRQASVGILDRVARVALSTPRTHLVHVSSVAVYSPRRSPALVDESWPRHGIPGATYSRLKVEAERRLLSLTAAAHAGDRVSVVRPCLVGQRGAAGPMLRCGAPAVLPGQVLDRLPAVPVDERFGIQMVHADDVADALVRVVERRACGAFNLAAEPVLRGRHVAAALGGRPIHVPQEVARRAVAAAWHAHLSPLDPGWVDMALQAPWVHTGRAAELLDWHPRHRAGDVLDELVRGMVAGTGSDTGALRPRQVLDGVRRAVTQGTVARRPLT